MRTRASAPLQWAGWGVTIIGVSEPDRVKQPFEPLQGYRLPVAVVADVRTRGGACETTIHFLNPENTKFVSLAGKIRPVAGDLYAPAVATFRRGNPLLLSLRWLFQVDRFTLSHEPHFMQPYDSGRIPVVLVHGLLSTPSMWGEVVPATGSGSVHPQELPILGVLLSDRTTDSSFSNGAAPGFTGCRGALPASPRHGARRAQHGRHHCARSGIDFWRPGALQPGFRRGYAPRRMPRFCAIRFSSTVLKACAVSSSVARRIAAAAWPWRDRREFPPRSSGFRKISPEPSQDHGCRDHDGPPEAADEHLRSFPQITVPSGVGPTPHRGTSSHDYWRSWTRGFTNSSDGVVPYSSAHLATAESELIVPADHGAFRHRMAIAEIEQILGEHLARGHRVRALQGSGG